MILDATCKLVYEVSESVPVLFMLRPYSSASQWVMRQDFHVHPAAPVDEFIDLYGNLCQRTVMPPGEFHVLVQYRVSVPEISSAGLSDGDQFGGPLPSEVLHYLLPSRYCESDLLGSKALEIVGRAYRDHEQVAAIRNWVHANIRNARETSTSSTSALDTLQSKQGVCRDFAHLGIALCRARNIPARMVVGFLHELAPMDLHAWFEAYIGGRWLPFDATQPSTRGYRIVIARGRDAADVALATLFGNFELRELSVSVVETVF